MEIADIEYLKHIAATGLLEGNCLEMGCAPSVSGERIKDIVEKTGARCFGSDIEKGESVDIILDLEWDMCKIKQALEPIQPLRSIILFNVMEHLFDPIRALDSLISELQPGGICVISTPAIWPLHYCPIDCWRILPDFYTEYCKRRECEIVDNTLTFLPRPKLNPLANSKEKLKFPYPTDSKIHYYYSKAMMKLFNLHGRHMLFPQFLSVGVVIRKGKKREQV